MKRESVANIPVKRESIVNVVGASGAVKRESVVGQMMKRMSLVPPTGKTGNGGVDRREDVFVQHLDNVEAFQYTFQPTKESSSIAAIIKALNGNVWFKNLGEIEYDLMVRTMVARPCKAGDVLITQGDLEADLFYVIEKGSFSYIVDGKEVGHGDPGSCFGELALLYNSPRAATVKALEEGLLWVLPRDTFRRIISSTINQVRHQVMSILQSVVILQNLSNEQLLRVCDIVRTKVFFKQGETIITKGDTGDIFYIIKSGTVTCSSIGNTENTLDLTVNEYFGERALMKGEPRYANVIAKTDVECITISQVDFDYHFGSLRNALDRNLGLRALKALPFLKDLENSERNEIAECFTEKIFQQGEYIFKQGDPGDQFYIVKDGICEVRKRDESVLSESVPIAKLNAGDYFGEGALLKDEPRGADIVAIDGPVTTFVLSRDLFELHFTKMKGSLYSKLSHRLNHTEDVVKQTVQEKESQVQFSELTHIRTLGTGTFGRVKLVEHKQLKKAYALKILQKKQVVDYVQENNVINEKNLLAECNHPFILRLVRTFKDKNCLYLLLELVQGGELFSVLHVHILPHVTDKDAVFYTACVLDAFEYLHDRSIVYRDLKPENCMIDDKGYIKVVDFGFAKKVTDKTFTLCGTPEYLAPEILLSQGHNKAADYWALGILMFEIITRRCPFADRDRMVMYENILTRSVEFPIYYSDLAKELTLSLLVKEPHLRLGSLKNGSKDIKNHAWFKSYPIDFHELRRYRYQAPWVPTFKDPLDSRYFDNYDENYVVEEYHPTSNWDDKF